MMYEAQKQSWWFAFCYQEDWIKNWKAELVGLDPGSQVQAPFNPNNSLELQFFFHFFVFFLFLFYFLETYKGIDSSRKR